MITYQLTYQWDLPEDLNPRHALHEAKYRFTQIIGGYEAEGFTQQGGATITTSPDWIRAETTLTGPPGWEYTQLGRR